MLFESIRLLNSFDENMAIFGIDSIFGNQTVEFGIVDFSNHTDGCMERMAIGNVRVHIGLKNIFVAILASHEMRRYMLFHLVWQ